MYAWRSFEAYPIVTQVANAQSVKVPLTAGHEHDLRGFPRCQLELGLERGARVQRGADAARQLDARIDVTVEISDLKHLEKVIKSLRGVDGVLDVERAGRAG